VTADIVRDAYSARAVEYIEVIGRIEHAAQKDRDYLLFWARATPGPLIDVGCGPGQWTEFFRSAGLDVEGVDPVSAFIEDARDRYPSARFRVARAEQLGVPDASLGGVLAWFSLIHMEPALIETPLIEFARCIRPGGSLAIGFFDGTASEPFDHAVTTAFYWSADALTTRLERAGFTVTDVQTRQDPGVRRQGAIVAIRDETSTV
jgi:ubiquinone/menaquinone biosynthesis C-methylase UbiE